MLVKTLSKSFSKSPLTGGSEVRLFSVKSRTAKCLEMENMEGDMEMILLLSSWSLTS